MGKNTVCRRDNYDHKSDNDESDNGMEYAYDDYGHDRSNEDDNNSDYSEENDDESDEY